MFHMVDNRCSVDYVVVNDMRESRGEREISNDGTPFDEMAWLGASTLQLSIILFAPQL